MAATQTVDSYTNSLLTTARACLRKYEWRYSERLELDTEEEREALAVGTCWHKAHEAVSIVPTDGSPDWGPYGMIKQHAPSDLWNEKLRRMYAAYLWYWASHDDEYETLETEHQFKIEHEGIVYEGSMDSRLRKPDGRTGLKEIKTTGDPIDTDSIYWRRWKLNTQIGLYALALEERPSFILVDVTKKPTIKPKRIIKKDIERMRGEYEHSDNSAVYCGEIFGEDHIEEAIEQGQESIMMYGARLTADITSRPEFYFARREITRTEDDYAELMRNLKAQVELISYAEANGLLHRNPSACEQYSCDFFALCETNQTPNGTVPNGYRRRAVLHPELS